MITTIHNDFRCLNSIFSNTCINDTKIWYSWNLRHIFSELNSFALQFCSHQDEKKDIPRVQVIVGICAMEKKSLSKPMKEILSRICEFEFIKTVIFPEDVIVNVSTLIYVIIMVFNMTLMNLIRHQLRNGPFVIV